MQSPQFLTLAAVACGLAACGPFRGQPNVQPMTGDYALRTHGHSIHATPASETGMSEIPLPDTVAVAAPRSRDSLVATNAAANRARADSLEQARLAALAAANAAASRARADSLEQTSATLREELAGLIHFDFDRAEIQPADRAALDRKAAILSANPTVRVRIGGYCDERGSDEYNLTLGNRRATAAKQYLIGRGIAAGRLDVASFGSASPLDPSQNEVAWTRNRRAGFEITSGSNALTAPVALR